MEIGLGVNAAPWWIWPIALFAVSFAIGIVAVLAGVGGGVLFVPIVGSLFPFHLDFVRGAGLMFALAGTLAAGPPLLRAGMASLRLVVPLALVGSIGSFAGALVGLALSTELLQISLGVLIIGIAILIWRSRSADSADVEADALGALLRLEGEFRDPAAGVTIDWRTRQTLLGLAAFGAIGFVGGIFGLGAGFANVPALNLLMAAPLKVAVGSSGLLISVINSSAAWVYIHRGALLPLVVVPSILGVMLGSRIGARLLGSTPAPVVRRLVIVVMLLAGLRALSRGLGWM
ncbi:MAG TPA: sulfite exporter TauE/SafE family protein [Burkholderiales bacterium]|nr:sulfite exporter TauE/SafE family protein [Burkholderiales bacterium]